MVADILGVAPEEIEFGKVAADAARPQHYGP